METLFKPLGRPRCQDHRSNDVPIMFALVLVARLQRFIIAYSAQRGRDNYTILG